MAVSAATALVVGAVATLAAGGLSYYAAEEQAATAQRMAAYNAAIQQQQANLQAQMQMRQAEINQAMLQSQINQTRALDQQADMHEAQAREQQRRLREEKLRLMGAQKAGFAAGGVVSEGTPLAVFAETEFNYALQEADVFKTASEAAQSLRREAFMQRFDLGNQLEIEKLNYNAAKAGRVIGQNNAAMTLAAGAAQSRAYKLAGYGTLLSTGANVAGQYGDYRRFSAGGVRVNRV